MRNHNVNVYGTKISPKNINILNTKFSRFTVYHSHQVNFQHQKIEYLQRWNIQLTHCFYQIQAAKTHCCFSAIYKVLHNLYNVHSGI